MEARRIVAELHLLGWAWGENGYWFVSSSCEEQLWGLGHREGSTPRSRSSSAQSFELKAVCLKRRAMSDSKDES